MNYIYYNPLSGNGHGKETAEEAMKKFGGELISVLDKMPGELISLLKEEDVLILCGGDGTVNRFANSIAGMELPCEVLLYKSGTGNDFIRDLEENYGFDDNTSIKKFITNLPKVKVKEMECHFINGIGFGLDGVCCEIADEQKEKGIEKINYTGIAIKLLLFGFRCPSAKVTIDGETKEFKRVWLASSMNGRYYGGGMKNAPSQDRLSDKLTCVIWHDSGKIATLMNFPNIFKGTHIKKEKKIFVGEGKEIKVEFSHPTSLQIDGETITGVTEYTAFK